MSSPHVTLLYGGLLGLLIAALGVNVTRLRVKFKVGVDGAPPPKPLLFAIRAHGNAIEWTPVLLLLLLLVELAGGASLWLHLAGGTLFLGRTLHALGLLTKLRTTVPGIVLSWGVAFWLPGWALVLHFAR